MCSRYSFSDNLDELVRVLQVESVPLERRYNVTPLSEAPVVVQHVGETPHIEMMQWGLVPWWAQDDRGAGKMTIAASETVAERPALRDAYFQRRCLVIADGFYQWARHQTPPQPWRFALGNESPVMMMAGIWESWRPVGAPAPLRTFSILTTTANASVANIHDRMPVILEPGDWLAWLHSAPKEALTSLLRPWSAALTAFPVTPMMEDPQFQGRECHEPHPMNDGEH